VRRPDETIRLRGATKPGDRYVCHDEKSAGATAISPFHIEVPQEEIDELRRRAQATRWPDRETVSDRSQGVQLAKLRPLVEYDKFAEWTDTGGEPEKILTYDEMLDAISLYWVTNTRTSSSRRTGKARRAAAGRSTPSTSDPSRSRLPCSRPRSTARRGAGAERTFDNLIYWNEVDKVGHFAAWEEPQLFSQEVRSCSPRKSGLRSGHCVDQRHEKQRR
jgi:hypothetical protein